MVERLSEYPWVIVRIDCSVCPHQTREYRLARLAAQFGPEATLSEVIEGLVPHCPWRTHPGRWSSGQHVSKCKVRFTDLEQSPSPPPPDLPKTPPKLTLIRGGKG